MPDCNDWFDVVGLALTAVATVAAAVAVYYAFQASQETKKLRRADRLADVAKAIDRGGDRAIEVARGAVAPHQVLVASVRLQTAIAATGEALPRAQALVTLLSSDLTPASFQDIVVAVGLASSEIGERLGQEPAT